MELKFCRDCKHCLPAEQHTGVNQLKYAKCAADPSPVLNDNHRVTGDGTEYVKAYCSTMRLDLNQACGREAKLFEPKP